MNNHSSSAAAAPPADTTGTELQAARSFAAFYPLYLREHANRNCRRLHFVGTTLVIVCLALLLRTQRWQFALLALLCGYGFAWIGHFVFEGNRPASFKRPLYSFVGDWVMYRDIWIGRIAF